MSSGGIATLAVVTALLTATGTVLVIEKTGVLKQPVSESVVPDVRGLSEDSAAQTLQSAKLVMLRAESEVSREAKPGTALRQSMAPGMKVEQGQTVLVTFAEAMPQVPGVTGMSVDEARHALKAKGYETLVGDPEFHDKIPEGKIISQTPAANQELEQGKTVIVKPSAGVGEVELPNFKGQAAKRASEEVEKLGLKPKIRWVNWAETRSNVVIKQEPDPGTKLERDAEVEFTVNR
jgi:serine/threonine-protein kinase